MRFTCMKPGVVLTLLALLFIQGKKPGSNGAQVQQCLNMNIYVLCEPSRDYEVLDNMVIDYAEQYEGAINFKQMANVFKFKPQRIKERFPNADALYSKNGHDLKIIKYNDQKDHLSRIGKARTINGMAAFVMAEPLKVHDTVGTISHNGILPNGKDRLIEAIKPLTQINQLNLESKPDALIYKAHEAIYIRYIEA